MPPPPTRRCRALAHLVPWWGWIGGCGGAVYVLATLLVARQFGAGAFVATTVTMAVVSSLAMDHWDCWGSRFILQACRGWPAPA